MLYEILKLFIPYVVLFISFGLIQINDSVLLVGRKNTFTFLIGILGTIIFVYSFFEMGKGTALYVKNIFENLNITSRTELINELVKIAAPVGIFTIIGVITLILSELYEKKNMKNINSMTKMICALSVWGAFVSILTTVLISAHTL